MAQEKLQTVVHYLKTTLGKPPLGDCSDRQLIERFAACRDEAAFESLVQRHGPLVLGVCQRILRHTQDAEDAFQGTFLVLARKAKAVCWQDSIRSWLYSVAFRVAMKARHVRIRSGLRDQQAIACSDIPSEAPTGGDELTEMLDEELARLPKKYRTPVVLCCLEGHSRDEAARRLGWTAGTVKGRLERGREMLRSRLARRGLVLSASLLTTELAQTALPSALATVTMRTVRADLRGGSLAIPQVVASLAACPMQSRIGLKLAVFALVATGTLAAGIITSSLEQRAEPQRPPHAEAIAKERPDVDAQGVPLPLRALGRLGDLRFRHGGKITKLAFAPDGKFLVSCSTPGDIAVWDVATGCELRRLGAERSEILTAVLAVNGRIVVGGDSQGFIHVWDPCTGQKVRQWKMPASLFPGPAENTPSYVSGLALSADGEAILSLDWMGTPNAWDRSTGSLLQSLHELREPFVQGMAYSPDGTCLAISYLKGSGGIPSPTSPLRRRDQAPPPSAPGLPGTPAVASSTSSSPLVSPSPLPVLPGTSIDKPARIPPQPPPVTPPAPPAPLEPTRYWYRVQLRDSKTGRLTGSIVLSKGSAAFLTFSPDGRSLAACRRSLALLEAGPPDEGFVSTTHEMTASRTRESWSS